MENMSPILSEWQSLLTTDEQILPAHMQNISFFLGGCFFLVIDFKIVILVSINLISNSRSSCTSA